MSVSTHEVGSYEIDFISPVLVEALTPILDEEYRYLLRESSHVLPDESYTLDTIQSSPLCRTASVGVSLALNQLGIESRPVSIQTPIAGVAEHRYVRAVFEDQEVLIDPTWQQFLPHIPDDAPRALVGSASHVRDIAQVWGVSMVDAARLWPDNINDDK